MDFSLILFIALIVTGLVSLAYNIVVEKKAARLPHSEPTDDDAHAARLPRTVEYSRALFPVILIVFVLRSFIVEPFRIPSESMLPTLRVGDLILVNKSAYGIRLPIVHQKIIPIGKPERGDVMVFRYPRDPELNFIKRVVGLPGDKLVYRDKQLFVNGQPAARAAEGEFIYQKGDLKGQRAEQYRESLDAASYTILIDTQSGTRDMEVSVPPGSYFVMGDNRDHSNDSRYWRFVPAENLVGEAFFIWFNIRGQWDRIGRTID